jgi:hypothetical protein
MSDEIAPVTDAPAAGATDVPVTQPDVPLTPVDPAPERDRATPTPATSETSETSATSGTSAAPTRASRRLALVAGLGHLARFAITVALLAAGVALGVATFQSRQVVATPAVPGGPDTAGIPAPAIVQELANALAANDSDRIRAAVPGSPYGLLTNEMGDWSFSAVTGVVTLGTYQDESRTATELIIRGRTADGSAVLTNLIVHAEDGLIVNFR